MENTETLLVFQKNELLRLVDKDTNLQFGWLKTGNPQELLTKRFAEIGKVGQQALDAHWRTIASWRNEHGEPHYASALISALREHFGHCAPSHNGLKYWLTQHALANTCSLWPSWLNYAKPYRGSWFRPIAIVDPIKATNCESDGSKCRVLVLVRDGWTNEPSFVPMETLCHVSTELKKQLEATLKK